MRLKQFVVLDIDYYLGYWYGKMIRLFIRDHIPLICFTAIQLLAIFLVYWFDGHNRIATALYAMFLGAFYGRLFTISLLYTSFFYERLANPMQSLDESVQKSDFAAISAALQDLLEVQYRHYQNQLQIQERKIMII